jgi:hypothetical protein
MIGEGNTEPITLPRRAIDLIDAADAFGSRLFPDGLLHAPRLRPSNWGIRSHRRAMNAEEIDIWLGETLDGWRESVDASALRIIGGIRAVPRSAKYYVVALRDWINGGREGYEATLQHAKHRVPTTKGDTTPEDLRGVKLTPRKPELTGGEIKIISVN